MLLLEDLLVFGLGNVLVYLLKGVMPDALVDLLVVLLADLTVGLLLLSGLHLLRWLVSRHR